jgi:hypothetical protein
LAPGRVLLVLVLVQAAALHLGNSPDGRRL